MVPSFHYQGNAYVPSMACNDQAYPCTDLVVDGVTYPYKLLGSQTNVGVQVAREACEDQWLTEMDNQGPPPPQGP